MIFVNELGEDRSSKYRRGSDSRFRDLYQLTQQFDLSPDTAGTLYEKHHQMQNEIARIQTDPNIAPESRDQAVRSFQSAMDTLLRQSLGEAAYQRLQAGGIDRFLGN